MRAIKIFKAILEALVLADVQICYKTNSSTTVPKPKILTERLKNKLVKEYDSINTISILYNNGRRATLIKKTINEGETK